MDRFFGRASWAASQVVGVAPQMIAQLDHAALQASGMAVLDDKAEAAKKQAALVSTAMASPGGAVGAQRAAGEIRRAKHGHFLGGISIWDGVLIAGGSLIGGFVGGSLVWAAVGGAAGAGADLLRRKVTT